MGSSTVKLGRKGKYIYSVVGYRVGQPTRLPVLVLLSGAGTEESKTCLALPMPFQPGGRRR